MVTVVAEERAPAPVQRVLSIAFWSLLLAGIVFRAVLIFSNQHTWDADRAVVYLMAVHVADGEFPTMYWGQSYGGTVLSLLAGLFMLLFGPHEAVLAFVSLGFFVGSAILVRALGRETLGRTAGDLAGVFFFLPGYLLILLSLADPGFYGPTIAFSLLALWAALRAVRTQGLIWWALAGLAAGLAMWQSAMGLALVAPTLVFAALGDRRWCHWFMGAAGALVGALPWLIETLRSATAVRPLGPGSGIQWRSFVTFFTEVFPAALTLNETTFARWAVAIVVGGSLLTLGIVALMRRSGALIALTAGTVLCLVVVVVVGAGIPLYADSYRYSLFVLPAVSLGLAWLLSRWWPLAALSLASMPIFVGVQAATYSTPWEFDTSQRYGAGVATLAERLEDASVDDVYADYWVSYALAAHTREGIVAIPLTFDRYPGYRADVDPSDPAVVVVYENLDNDRMLQILPGLPPYQRDVWGGYAVYRFEGPIDVDAIDWSLF